VAKITTDDAVYITVRMPRHAWPEKLWPLAHHFQTSTSLVRGRLTRRAGVMAIRIEGLTREIENALHYWECCGFKVDKGVRNGSEHAVGETRNDDVPQPSPPGRGSSSRGSLDLLPKAARAHLGKRCFF